MMSKIDSLLEKIERTAGEYRHALNANIARDADQLADLIKSAKESGVVARIHAVISKHAPWMIETGPTTFMPLVSTPVGAREFPLGIRLSGNGDVVLELRAGGAPEVVSPEAAARWINESSEFSLPADVSLCFERYLERALMGVQHSAETQKARSGRGAS